MKTNNVKTIIIIDKIPMSGMYATIQQENGPIIQYPYSIDGVRFFTNGSVGYARSGWMFVDKPMSFILDFPLIDKVPIKRKENPNRKEHFFFMGHTFFINADAVELKGPFYYKVDLRQGKPTKVDNSNFALEEVYEWQGAMEEENYSRYVWYDHQMYTDMILSTNAMIDKMKYQADILKRIEFKIDKLTSLNDRLKQWLKWWERATVNDILKEYKKQNKKGGKENA